MTTLERLGADDLRRVVAGFRDALVAHREGINRLNVYPVPDGDTGSNMASTMVAAAGDVEAAADDLPSVCKAFGTGALYGGRGNSGAILSAIVGGFCAVAGRGDSIDGQVLAEALAAGTERAYGSVPSPVEGTILTVVREASEAATAAAAEGKDLAGVLEAAHAQGYDALARTPDLLPKLAEAGVVDSGGTGLLLLLDVLRHVVDGHPVPEPSVTEEAASHLHLEAGEAIDHEHAHGDVSDLRYEVMYFLEAPDDTIAAFKDVWAGIGDSIVVVGGDGLWNCHIHTDDIGASIEAALDVGRPRRIRVTDLLEEVEEERWVRDAGAEPEPEVSLEPVTTAVVAIATGDGIRRIFHSLKVQVVIAGGQSMNPSTAEILAAVESAPADSVVVLPNNKNIIAVAEQVDALTSKAVRVIPTRGIPEGFAALLEYDPEADLDTNAEGMVDAAENVVAGEVTRAVRDSSCDVGPIKEGDYLGIGRAGIRAVAPTVDEAATGLLADLLTDEHEILTLIEGEGASAASTRRITEWAAEHHPDVSVEVHHGGQPLYPYFLGVE